jgi:arylsulfatase A-like enzyme
MEKGGRGARRRFARYARDGRVADHFFGEILSALRDRGRLERTVVAVVADHGEEFLDHGEMGHGVSMWTETLRVPFVLRAPGLVPGVHRGRVSLLDVVPTLVDLAGIEAPTGFEGRSLVGELEDGGTRFSSRPVFAHLFTQPVRLDRDLMAERTFTGDLAVLQDQWKLVVRDYGGHADGGASLFDLRNDPGERHDVANLHPERVAEMIELARAWYRTVRSDRPVGDEVLEIQPEALEQLRALGYLD